MSWSKSVTIWCDGENCPEWIEPGYQTIRAARREAEGWKYSKGKDYCPECK